MNPASSPRTAEWAERFFRTVEEADETEALDLVDRALEAGIPPERVLLEIIAPAQARVGVEWAEGRLSVAHEHAASAVSDRAVAALSLHPAARVRPHRGRITTTCVDGEWHALPARLVAEVLKLRGWRVDFLGAHVPTPHLITHMHATGPDVVALSCSLPVRLPAAHAAVTACHAAGVPVLAGGAGFGPDGRYARLLGADAWAATGMEAADLLERGLSGAYAPPDERDPLPHLADQEYTLVTQTRHVLLEGTMADLAERFPALRDYSARQTEHTREDVGHIIDFLATSLYVDDPGLFSRFLLWTAEILAARDVPVHSLTAGLDALRTRLTEFPRAVRTLEEGREAVHTVAPGTEGTA
jgi:methanogenic corrinoid protein MtbC1